MQLTGETKLFIGLILATVLIIVVGVVVYSRPEPVLPKEQLVTSTSHTRGNKDAKTYLVEFSDFQCPACGFFQPVVEEILKKNQDKLFFVYRHFPLDQHEFSRLAVTVAEAAGEQGKFWEMHDYLFANQAKFSTEFLNSSGEKLGLDVKKFTENVKSEKYKDIIVNDLAAGQKFGVSSTPTFYLNGRKINITYTKDLENAVDKEIAKNN